MMLSAALVTLSLSLFANGLSLPAQKRDDCSCGYRVSAHNNEYYQHKLDVDFSTIPLSGTATSASWLGDYGLSIADGYRGGALSSDGVTDPYAHFQNVRINNGALELVVPGGQSAGGQTSNAQIEGPIVVGGVFSMEAKIDATKGTCQSIFTYHTQDSGGNDEQDIEILGSYLFEAGDNGTPPGIELTNYNPSGEGNDNTIVPFPTDPTTDFHKYTIAWTSAGTSYLFDDAPLNSPPQFSSVNPSVLVLNHWTNGDPGFTQGPPANDAVMSVRRLTGYYKLPEDQGMPAGCSDAQVCTV